MANFPNATANRIESLHNEQSGKYDDQTTIRMTRAALNMPNDRKIWVDKCGMVFLNMPFGNQYKTITCAYDCLPYVESKLWEDHNPEYLTVTMITKKQADRLYHTCCKNVKSLTLQFAFKCNLSSILDSLELLYTEGKTIKLINVIKDCDAPTEGFIYD